MTNNKTYSGGRQVACQVIRTVEKTFSGRTMFTVTLLPNKRVDITGSYPAVGVDPVSFEVANDMPHDMESVADFRVWLAQSYETVEPLVRAARARRYVNRSEAFNTEEGE